MDRKDRDYYDNLSDEFKKQFSGFLMLRYSATVNSNPELEHYYIASTNHYANRGMFDLSKHPKLQWLMLTAASPGLGLQRHTWLKQPKKGVSGIGPVKKELATHFPTMKDDDLEVLSKLITKKELTEYVKAHGEGYR
jgi:hypothetical protein